MPGTGAKPFGYTGEENTCLWCGRRLHFEQLMARDSQKDDPTYEWDERGKIGTVRAAMPGPYQDGLFDTLRCGFEWAVRLARLGHRLELDKS